MDRIERHKELALTLNDIYKAKNYDYGDAFGESCDEFGPVAGLIRMNDKMNRLKSLINDNHEQKVSDESIKDTLLDLANYSLMLEVWFEGTSTNDIYVPHVRLDHTPIGEPEDRIDRKSVV